MAEPGTLTPERKAELLAELRARADRRDAEEERYLAARAAALAEMRAEAEEREANRDHEAEAAVRIAAARPDWQSDALCKEYPDLPWFPEKAQSTAEAKAVCARCLVVEECKAYALRNGIRWGIWGGETAVKLHRSAAA